MWNLTGRRRRSAPVLRPARGLNVVPCCKTCTMASGPRWPAPPRAACRRQQRCHLPSRSAAALPRLCTLNHQSPQPHTPSQRCTKQPHAGARACKHVRPLRIVRHPWAATCAAAVDTRGNTSAARLTGIDTAHKRGRTWAAVRSSSNTIPKQAPEGQPARVPNQLSKGVVLR